MSKLKRSVTTALLSASLIAPLWSYPANVQAEASDSSTVSFLYFNDGHEISPVMDKLGTRGGVARIKTLVDGVQGEKIVAFGGDLGGGTLFGGVFKGFPMVEAFNQIPIDLANFGQHDFDAGAANAKKLVEASKFSWLSSNLIGSDGKPFGQVPEYAVIEKQGIRIGVIGLTSAMETTTKDGTVQQQDVIESAKKAVEKVKQQKADVIIALTQEPVADDKALMAAVPDIQVIFTEEEAEEKSFVYEVETGKKFIFSPQGNMGSIIHLRLKKEKDGGVKLSHEILKADETVAEDDSLAKLAADYQTKLDTELGKKVATLTNDLPYGDNHESRFRETAIGNLIADAYRDYYQTDMAFANGGGIRASAKKGDFTLKDAKAILPFGNKIVVAEVTGDMVLAALENSVAGVDRLAGGFLQVSGLTYVYDANKPVRERIVEAKINQQPIQKEAVYKLALSNFMYTGGDNYSMFAKAKTIVGANEALTDFELLAAYASKQQTVAAQPEARIAVRGFADVPSSHWAQPAIKALTDKAVLTVVDEGRFAPQASVTRKEALQAIAKLFPEASASVWSGSGLGTADESAALSREELAVVVHWLYEKKTGKPLQGEATTAFADDAQIADSFKPAVAALVKAGLVEGRQSGQFAPKEKATRAEFAHLLAKISS